MPVGIGLSTAALLAAKAGGLTAAGLGAGAGGMALAAGAGTGIGALPDIIPSRYERDQKKRLREMQRKQEMGALGLTKAERDAIEGQMRGTRQQAQSYADAERARLTQPSAQPQMALLGQQMADEGRQRLEADLASQVLGMDLSRQASQEQEIKDLEAAQGEYRRRRFEGAVAPFQSGAETYVGQLGMDRMLRGMSQNQIQNAASIAAAQAVGTQTAETLLASPNRQQIASDEYNINPEEQAMLGMTKDIPVQMPTGTDAQLFDQMDTGIDYKRLTPEQFKVLEELGLLPPLPKIGN
tara:strand:- start:83 stop:973 length:891 start_codon:yes stop_codon:yes gene_type:complete